MKVAICLSGQLRTWKECYTSWVKLLDELKKSSMFHEEGISVDYFIHTWRFNSIPYALFTKERWDNGLYFTDFNEPEHILIPKNEIEEFINTINPKQYLIEGSLKSKTRKKDLDERLINRVEDDSKWAPISWAGSQLYSIMMADKLKRDQEIINGYDYDLCIRLRNDLHFDDNNIALFCREFEKPQKKRLYICHSHNTPEFPYDAIGDIFFYSDSVTFDVMCSAYNYLPLINPDIFPPDVKVETILAYIARMFDIKTTRLKLDPEVRR